MRNLLALALLLALAVAALAAPVPLPRKSKWPAEIAPSEIVGVYEFSYSIQGQPSSISEIVLSSDGTYCCLWCNREMYEGVWRVKRAFENGAHYVSIHERKRCEPEAELQQWTMFPVTRQPDGSVQLSSDGYLMRKRQLAPLRSQVNGRNVEPEGKR